MGRRHDDLGKYSYPPLKAYLKQKVLAQPAQYKNKDREKCLKVIKEYFLDPRLAQLAI